ncbi:MAG: peptidylprolyl isomerase [Chloroflexota bacterium]
MPKKRPSNKPIEQTPSSKTRARDSKGRWTPFIIASVVIALILIIVGVSYYTSEDAQHLRLTVISVDDTAIKMDYFLKRVQQAGGDSMGLLTSLTNELLIKLGAPRYGIQVSTEEINQELRRIASGESGNITENEFKEWYRQQLNETGFSDSEYKDIVRTSLLATYLQEYLAERVPTVAEQIHLHNIMLETYEDAANVKARWEAGEDFATLAREASLDADSKENGGDLGWLPRGVLDSVLEEAAFSLGTDNVSEPLPFNVNQGETDDSAQSEPIYYYILLMVSEKDPARELVGDALQAVQNQALTTWLSEETQYHTIHYNYDSEIYAWINWQISKETSTTNSSSE